MRPTARRLLSTKAILAYLVLALIALNQFVGAVANIDFVITAQGNSRLVSLWNFFATPKGNLLAILLVAVYITILILWPQAKTNKAVTVEERETRPPQRQPVIKVVEVEANIRALTPEMIDANRHDDEVIVSGQVVERLNHFWNDESKNLGALVVPFQNRIPDSGREIGTVDDISGRLLVRSYSTNQSQELNRVAWLDEEESRVYFGRNDTYRLIIITLEGTEKEPRIYSIHKQSTGTRRGGDRMGRSELKGSGVFGITVSLVDESKSKVLKKSEFVLEIKREPEFDISFADKITWQRERLNNFYEQGTAYAERLVYQKEGEAALRPAINKWMMDCKAFARQHINENEARLLGQSLSELEERSPFAKRLIGADKSVSRYVLDFLTAISKLRSKVISERLV
jgi:hypothetical protein